jgi:hypothetical protein
MAITFVGANSAEATSLTLPAHQKNDLIVICAMRGSLVPSIPTAGWIVINTRLSNSYGHVVAYKIASSSGEPSGTWTSALLLASAVYRDDSEFLSVGNCTTGGQSGTTSVIYGGLGVRTAGSTATSRMRTSAGYVVGYGGCSVANGGAQIAPSSMVNRTSISGAAVNQIAIHDTNSEVSSYSSETVTVSSSTVWAITFEIHRSGILLSSGANMSLVGPGGLVY